MSPVKAIPEGYHSVQPYLYVRGAGQAIEFYKKAFGATEIMRMPAADGRLMHAEVRIGDSVVMMADEHPERKIYSPAHFGGATSCLMLYVGDCDAVYRQAVAAGGRECGNPPISFMAIGWRESRIRLDSSGTSLRILRMCRWKR